MAVSDLHAQPASHLSLGTLQNVNFRLEIEAGVSILHFPALGPSVADTSAALFCCGMQMVLVTGLTRSMQSA